MFQRRASTVAATAAALISANAFAASEAQPRAQELIDQIKSLQSRVEQLEAQQKQASTQPAAAITGSGGSGASTVDATVSAVMNDAWRRSQWLQANSILTTYKDGKFILQSEDGDFLLHPWLQFQPRFVANIRDNAKTNGDDDTQSGFEIRRMKFGFDGNVFSPKMTYQFMWATNRKSGVPELEEAWVKYKLADDWFIQGGQIKDPFSHESLVSSKMQLAAERSLLIDNFAGGDNYVQGVALGYAHGDWHATAAFTDGARNNFNQNFQDFPTNNADYGAAARVEYKVFGDWADYSDFTALNTRHDLLVVGGGLDYTEAGNTGIFMQTIDAQYKCPDGFSLYGAYVGRYTNNFPVSTTPPPAEFDTYDYGFVGQAAYMLDRHWEPFARYEYINFDAAGLAAGSENNVHVIAIGTNYYLHAHAAKFTVDFLYLPNGSPVADDGGGILTSDGNAEYILRAQFQLLL